MHKLIRLLIVVFLFQACGNIRKEEKAYEPVMYEPTEMALLMRQMYEFNKVTKAQILKSDTLLSFPEEFKKIHTAVLTDPSERDHEFDSLARIFLASQEAAFSSVPDSAAYHFNRSVNECITCHETRCIGPLPKIKKLLID